MSGLLRSKPETTPLIAELTLSVQEKSEQKTETMVSIIGPAAFPPRQTTKYVGISDTSAMPEPGYLPLLGIGLAGLGLLVRRRRSGA